MSVQTVTAPYSYFPDRAGAPLTGGRVYVGVAGANPITNPVAVYFDSALSIPAAQPIQTSRGFALNSGAPTRVFVDAAQYSIVVQDANGQTLYSSLRTDTLTGNALQQAEFNAFLALSDPYKRTPAEIAAGITPTDYTWLEGWVPRYGALADGSVETTAVQRALTVGMQGPEVVFPPYKTYVVGQMRVKHGMNIRGHGASSELKLKADSDRFTRIFTTEDDLWDSTLDSPILHIRNLRFNGNRQNQGAYTNFEKEQQSPIFVAGHNDQNGRLRFIVENCDFIDTAGDGIHQYWNSDGVVTGCFFQDCFRSSVAVTGGYSKLRINNSRGIGATHDSRFQVEIDGAGFNSQQTMELLMDNCDWAGGLDIAVAGGSTIFIANTYFRADGQCITNLDGTNTGINTDFTAVNCFFRIGTNSSNTHRFLKYCNSKFIGCTFEYTNATTHQNLIQPGGRTGQSIVFDNCTFRGDATYHTAATVNGSAATWGSGLLTVDTAAAHGLVAGDFVELAGWTTDVNGVYKVRTAPDTDTITIVFPRDPGAVTVGSGTTRKRSTLNALSMSADTAANANQVHIINCKFDQSVDCAFFMQQGGWLQMRGNHVDAGMLYHAGAAASFLYQARIGQFTSGLKHRQMCHVVGSVPGCTLTHEDTFVNVEKSGFTIGGNLTGVQMFGARRVYGSGGALSTDPCFMGDIYRRDIPLAATIQQYCALTGAASGSAATWKAETTLAA